MSYISRWVTHTQWSFQLSCDCKADTWSLANKCSALSGGGAFIWHKHGTGSEHSVGAQMSRCEHTCRPQQPTAFMTEALWMTLYGIPAFTARNTRSLWVVALQGEWEKMLGTISSSRWIHIWCFSVFNQVWHQQKQKEQLPQWKHHLDDSPPGFQGNTDESQKLDAVGRF